MKGVLGLTVEMLFSLTQFVASVKANWFSLISVLVFGN